MYFRTTLTEIFKIGQNQGTERFKVNRKKLFAKLENFEVAQRLINDQLCKPDFFKDNYNEWNEILKDKSQLDNMIKIMSQFDKKC